MPSGIPSTSAIVALLTLSALAVLIGQWRQVRGTTLVACVGWSLACVLSVAAVELLAALGGQSSPSHASLQPLRFVAAMSVFCPPMALLGAKRPQDLPWQFVVLTLWVVLSLPGLEGLAFGGMEEVHPARAWFLGALVAVATLNSLCTRFWPSALLTCMAQIALVGPHLTPDRGGAFVGWAPLAGLALLVAAWALMAVGWPRPAVDGQPLDRVWRDFRDGYGAVWALRVMQRMNASSEMYDWPVTLGWRGFAERHQGSMPDAVPVAVDDSLRTLLRRFVSPEWIDARLAEPSAAQR